MAGPPSELETVLADAGGAGAPREVSARLRNLLAAELRRGMVELGESRTGYETPIVVAVGATESEVVAALPISPELRADPGAVGERSGALASATVEHLVEGASPGPPRSGDDLSLRLGDLGGMLAFVYPAAEPAEAAEYAHEALTAEFEERRIDRLRASSHLMPGHVLEDVSDLRPPIGATHPLRVAEAVTRLGGSPLDDETVEALEHQLLQLLEPAGAGHGRTRTRTRSAAWRAGSCSGYILSVASSVPSLRSSRRIPISSTMLNEFAWREFIFYFRIFFDKSTKLYKLRINFACCLSWICICLINFIFKIFYKQSCNSDF